MQRFEKMKRLQTFLLIVVAVVQTNAGYLRALGPNIVDSTNQPVLLRGVGLGGWLVPEGYMLHTPGYGSPSDIEAKVRDLIGSANTTQFYQLYKANYVNRNDIQLIAQWGYNSIRLPFHYKLLYDSSSATFRAEGFALLDSLLAWCESANMYVILDMHCAPGGQNKDNISDSDGIEARLWTNPANQTLTIKIWKEIARHYATRKIVGGYDLLNEPVLPSGYNNIVLRDFYKQLTDTIRTVDPNHIVFIEGNWYATDFNQLTPPFVTNMVYSFHKYWNETSAATIQNYVTLRTQYFVPLWMGESGENSNPWFHEVKSVLEQYNIGWCWWTHKKIATITSPLSSPIASDYQTVLNYWNGQAPRPTEAFATNALFQMTQNLALANCEPHPDVLKSLFDPAFGTESKPFKTLSVPGIVRAVDYDLGTQGIAYSDAEYKNEGGLNVTPYNQGWQFRNDGVDIERCQDASGAQYNVGWTAAGEWLNYTVRIATAGVYRVNVRVAAPDASGQIRLYLDGSPVTNVINVPQSGGWQSWRTLTIEGVNLPAGQHVLMVAIPTSGFNFNQMEFVLVSADVKQISKELPPRFELMQNFPNPFNPSTTITFTIPVGTRHGVSVLKVFDLFGKEVATLVNEELTAGVYQTTFDASNLASGTYFYQLSVSTPSGKAGSFVQTRKLLVVR